MIIRHADMSLVPHDERRCPTGGAVPAYTPYDAVNARGLRIDFARFSLGSVDLSLAAGERVGLIGINGAGKSTLLSAIGGRLLRYGGSVRVLGEELRDVLPGARERIGVLPERVAAYDWMTVDDYLRLHATFFAGWDRAVEDALVARLQLDRTARMHTLSKGTRVKVAFVAAEAFAPELVLLDEPTSGLDPFVRGELLACIRERLDARPTRTLLFSTHIMEDIVAIAHRVLVLRAGRLVLDSPLAGLVPPAGGTVADCLREAIRAS